MFRDLQSLFDSMGDLAKLENNGLTYLMDHIKEIDMYFLFVQYKPIIIDLNNIVDDLSKQSLTMYIGLLRLEEF